MKGKNNPPKERDGEREREREEERKKILKWGKSIPRYEKKMYIRICIYVLYS